MNTAQKLADGGINPFAAQLLLESILLAEQRSDENREALKKGFLFPIQVCRKGEKATYQVLIVREGDSKSGEE